MWPVPPLKACVVTLIQLRRRALTVRMWLQVLYSVATQRFSRGTVFNIVMSAFLAFMAAFGLLYPSHEALHFSTLAGKATGYLPSGTGLSFCPRL